MKILSRWKLTFDPGGVPRVLLDLTDLIENEMQWKLNRAVEVVPVLSAAAPFIRPAGNNSYTIDFTVYRGGYGSDAGSRTAIMDTLATVDNLGKKPLRVQLGNEAGLVTGVYWQFQQSIIREMDAYKMVEGSRLRIGTRYVITATNLVKVNS